MKAVGAYAAFDEFEVAGWAAKDAADYDFLLGRVTARVAEPLLDVGTGPGHLAGRAVARGAVVVGIDFSARMVEFAAAGVPAAEFVVGDARQLPFEDASFDAVVAAFLLMHLGAPELAVGEAARVLRPGGCAGFSVWDVPAQGRWLAVFYGAVADAGAVPPAELPPAPDMFALADDAGFSALLEGAGLEDVGVSALTFPLGLSSADELWDGLVGGTARTGPLVRAQPADVQAAIRRGFDERLAEFRRGDGFEVPVAVKIAHGSRPA